MRTKTLLLAVAALAAGLATSKAQVYSANIVGYVNVPVVGGKFNLIANPLSTGTNGANEVLPFMLSNPVFDDSVVVTFTPPSTYSFYQYDQGTPGWLDGAGAPTTTPKIAPGTGFFFNNSGPSTNITFVGTVVPNPGSTNQQKLPGGYSLVGSPLPVGGSPTNTGPGTLNMPWADGIGTVWITFTPPATYTFYAQDGGWVDASDSPGPAPSFSVGQGFFLQNNAGNAYTNWTQTITNSP